MLSLPEDVQAKLDRASSHLVELYRAERELLSAANPRIELDTASDPPCYRFRRNAPAGSAISVMIGDVAHNLRCALDYSICRLALTQDTSFDTTHVQFPFGEANEPLNARDRQRVKGLSAPALARIERARVAGGAALHLLRAISNQDKHRLLVTNFFQTEQAGFTVDLSGVSGTVGSPALDTWKIDTPLKDGDILAIGHHEQFTPNFAFMLCFSIEGRRGHFRLQVLSSVETKVREAVSCLTDLPE